MTDKEIELIYNYMGWEYWQSRPTCALDSNSAWKCVQEMERKEDWHDFYIFMFEQYQYAINNLNALLIDMHNFALWSKNPTNFFNCFSKWLEVKHEGNV